MMEAEAAGKSMMEAEAVRQPAEAEIMLLPAASASIMILYPCWRRESFQEPEVWSRITALYCI